MTTNSGVQPRARSIHSCNFRYAGRLSNENARALTSLHEKFALNVTNSLEAFLGTSIRLKMVSLEQLALGASSLQLLSITNVAVLSRILMT